ncbi:MAG TPA: endonuclease domain-containing protein [Candidatus Limnocylindrales bacterium]|nr:endonuclease domain-containing protein [Candidatus Limnocylindrales bacterium]
MSDKMMAEQERMASEVDAVYRDMAAQVMVNVARDLRQRQTGAEDMLWEALRGRQLGGFKFRRQHPIAGTAFVADFLCYEARLVIELDGPVHESQQQEDAWRQSAIEDAGYRVVRFLNERVFHQLPEVLFSIHHAAMASHPSP